MPLWLQLDGLIKRSEVLHKKPVDSDATDAGSIGAIVANDHNFVSQCRGIQLAVEKVIKG